LQKRLMWNPTHFSETFPKDSLIWPSSTLRSPFNDVRQRVEPEANEPTQQQHHHIHS